MIRQREYDLITDLLEILPKIDNMPQEEIAQARDALFHTDHPFLMVFVGPFNAGKSTLINALLGAENLLKAGPVPTTDRIQILRWGDEPQTMTSASDVDTVFYPSPLLRKVSFVDTPGLESVLQHHEKTTANFLHRSDVVMLVMLANQAMTQSNLKYLQDFKRYGKKVILIINQIDLLSPEEQKSVREYVANHSRDRLGFDPIIWMVSAQQGVEARNKGVLDEEKWQQSGLAQIQAYIEKQLSDVERLRQKLHTPLQIVQNVHTSALTIVKRNQNTFDQYRSIADNIDQQISAQRRDLDRIVRETNAEVASRFQLALERSKQALAESFSIANILRALIPDVLRRLPLIGRALYASNRPTPTRLYFDQHKVLTPFHDVPNLVDKLAERLEGQDMGDIDNLVAYGQRELKNLPPSMQDKVIGTIQAPLRYDRQILQSANADLEAIIEETLAQTRVVEQARRDTILYFLTVQMSLIILAVLVHPAIALALLLGFLIPPLRRRLIHTQYTNQLLKLNNRHAERLTEATDAQIEYAVKLRHTAIAPLSHLITSQANIHDEQLKNLKKTENDIQMIETSLNALGKRSFLGMTL